YLVLGHLIEKLSGGSYGAFVQANLFTPAGMKDSGYDTHAAIIPHRASRYVTTGAARFNAPFIAMTIPHAAGSLYSTTEDLLRWESALFGGRILSAASFEAMTTPFKNDYAFGLVVHTVAGRKVIEHNGGINGFNTALAYYPDSRITIVVLGNLNGRSPEQIAAALGVLAHG